MSGTNSNSALLALAVLTGLSGCADGQSDFDANKPLECVFLPTGETFRQSTALYVKSGNWTVGVKRGEWTQEITNETADKWRCRTVDLRARSAQ